jgi:uncharacterized glyoxalase superfamily protein PhnB
MTHGDGVVMIGTEWADWTRIPAGRTRSASTCASSAASTSTAHARGEPARRIVKEPEDQFYGGRIYIAADLEGHYWTFSQPVRNVSEEEMEKASGFKFERLQ